MNLCEEALFKKSERASLPEKSCAYFNGTWTPEEAIEIDSHSTAQ
jgi:hypothetical protein